MSDKDELPYRAYTSHGYVVIGSNCAGLIEIADEYVTDCSCRLFLTASDLRMMLDRIERGKK